MTRSRIHYFLAAAAPAVVALAACKSESSAIDRVALLERNNPRITEIDTLASLTVGNGGFAFTVDATGLQTFPELYSKGVPLGTQSHWGWHSFPNPEKFTHDETLKDYDFGRGRQEPYSVQFNEAGRNKDAANWYRVNPHRLHLGALGFAGLEPGQVKDINQTLDLMKGEIRSNFTVDGKPVSVSTTCHPDADIVAASISSEGLLPVSLRFPYPTGGHCDDACDWASDSLHTTEIVEADAAHALIRHNLDSTSYYVDLAYTNASAPVLTGANTVTITPTAKDWTLTATFSPEKPAAAPSAVETAEASAKYWGDFWNKGGVVDFSHCTDPRAKELERRVVLSQYLLAAQCAAPTPPQETGLTYNSWFGKFHLEMIWWHQAQFALYGHEDLLARTLPWYESVAPVAAGIASRQGFEGLRWMKMTDPSGTEAPSKVGSFLIWQQPHLIYLAELLYRANPSDSVIDKYYDLVQGTAKFMTSFAEYDGMGNRYVLRGAIPAQETLRAAETVNPPFELSYWHFALSTAQKWRERKGEGRNLEWDEIIDKMSPLAAQDSLYLAAETALETYKDTRFTSDHMAVLAAVGVLPMSPLVREDLMLNTFDWIYDNWQWGRTWGWDYPTTAMNAVRLGQPERALNALLMDKRTNTYLPNGHNYQDKRLRCYLPGNGGLLTAVALMTAGWDGCEEKNPGFPKDGTWDVRWEGIKPLP